MYNTSFLSIKKNCLKEKFDFLNILLCIRHYNSIIRWISTHQYTYKCVDIKISMCKPLEQNVYSIGEVGNQGCFKVLHETSRKLSIRN